MPLMISAALLVLLQIVFSSIGLPLLLRTQVRIGRAGFFYFYFWLYRRRIRQRD